MTLQFAIDFPPDIEERLRRESLNLEAEAREAFAVELYRRDVLDRWELGRVLGLDRFEVEALLKRHNEFKGSLTMEDLEADRQTLDKLLGKIPDAGSR